MDKSVALAGIFGILAIIGIVLFVNGFITGKVSYYPAGMQLRTESGVQVLQSEVVVNQVCRNAIFCEGQSRYVCCNHDGSSCAIPSAENQAAGSCPLSHRSRCQCREDYIAGLEEKYG